MKYTYLQSLITLDQADLLNDLGYILSLGLDKYGNKIVSIAKED
jgi:hypothetical protein